MPFWKYDRSVEQASYIGLHCVVDHTVYQQAVEPQDTESWLKLIQHFLSYTTSYEGSISGDALQESPVEDHPIEDNTSQWKWFWNFGSPVNAYPSSHGINQLVSIFWSPYWNAKEMKNVAMFHNFNFDFATFEACAVPNLSVLQLPLIKGSCLMRLQVSNFCVQILWQAYFLCGIRCSLESKYAGIL